MELHKILNDPFVVSSLTVLKLSEDLNVTYNIVQYILHCVYTRLPVKNVVVVCFHPLIHNSSTTIHHMYVKCIVAM